MAQGGLAPHQKKARRLGASIVFIDESGFRLQPVNRRTWAPTGQTPVQRAWDRYDRLSVLGAVVLSPSRSRIDTPFQIQEENVRTPDVVTFIYQLRKRHRRPLIICWDRWSVHRSAHKQIATSRMKAIHFEFLPAYAPELNPVEACWSHAKYAKLANFIPDDVGHLKRQVRSSLKKQRSDHLLKQSFFKTAKLKI
jgi:transposase